MNKLEDLRHDLSALRQKFRDEIPIAVQLTITRLEKWIRRLEQEQHNQGVNHEQKGSQ